MADGNVSIQGLEFDLKANTDASTTQAIEELASSLSHLKSVLGSGFNSSNATNSIKNVTSAINSSSKSKTSGASAVVTPLSSSDNGTQIKPSKSVKEASEEAKKLAEAKQKLIDSKSDSIYQNTRTFLNGFGSTIKSTTGYMGKFLSVSKDLAGGVWDRMTSGVRSSVAQFENLRRSFGRILLYRAIRTLIKNIGAAFQTGIADLYQYSTIMGGTFAKSMDTLSTSMLYLKNSMATMAAPLINAVAPAIDYLIDKVVALMNVIAQAMAALTGAGTWDKAIKFPKKYATAVGDANGAAKELEKTVLGFDELNRLNDNNNSSGGSGFSADDYSNMFTTESVTSKFKDMMNQSNWTKVGESIAEGLNAGLTKVDNWINIKFAPQAKIWATRMGTMLNGFVSKFDWSLLGKTVGDGLNSITDAFNTYYASAGDAFTKIGSGIATSINSFFNTVDWSGIGMYLSNKLNAWVDVFSGFFTTLSQGAYTNGFDLGVMMKNFFLNIDWNGIRIGLSGMLKTIADTLEGFITGQDGSFDNFTTEFANTINSVFENPDISRILNSLGTMFNSIVTGIGKLDWYSIGKTIGTALGSIDWNNVLSTLGSALLKALGGVFDGLFNSSNGTATLALLAGIGALGGLFKVENMLTDTVLKKLAEDIAAKLVSKDGLGALSDETGTAFTGLKGIGSDLGTALSSGVTVSLGTIGAAIGVFTVTYSLTTWVLEQTGLMDKLKKAGSDLYDAFHEGQAKAGNDFEQSIDDAYSYMQTGQGDANQIMTELQTSYEDFRYKTDATSQANAKSLTDMMQYIQDKSGVMSSVLEANSGSTTQKIKDDINDAALNNDNAWVDMSDTAKARLDSMQLNADGSFSAIKDTISSDTSDFDTKNNDTWIDMSDTTKQKLDEMKTNTETGMDSVSSHYSGSLDDMKNQTDNIWSSIGDTFDNWISNIQRSLSFDVNARYNFTDGGRMPEYATGGFPEDGIFMANHGEMVGSFSNGRTAVANNDQIVSGITSGVYEGVMAAMGNSNSGETPQVNVYIGNEQLDSFMATSQKRLALASGGR